MILRACCLVLALVGILLQGCVAVQTFPTVARSGDTITLAVGSPDGMTKANTTATFVSPDLANPVNLPIRSIIKLRADNTSFVGTFDAMTSYLSSQSSHAPWLTIIVIDLPTGLPVGAANINVTTLGQYNVGANVNSVPIGIEILSGTGSPNPFNYTSYGTGSEAGDLTDLESLPQVVVKPPLVSAYGGATFVGAVIKVTAPSHIKSTGLQIPDGYIRVIADDMSNQNSDKQLQMFWTRSGDDYTVNFVSNGGTSYAQTRFSIVLYPSPDYEFVPGSTPMITSITYYDANGNAISGLPLPSDYSVMRE